MHILRIPFRLRDRQARSFSLKPMFDFFLQRDLFKANYALISGNQKAAHAKLRSSVYPRSVTDTRFVNSARDGLAGHIMDLLELDSSVGSADIQRAGALDRLLGPNFLFLDNEKICVVHGLSTLPVSVESRGKQARIEDSESDLLMAENENKADKNGNISQERGFSETPNGQEMPKSENIDFTSNTRVATTGTISSGPDSTKFRSQEALKSTETGPRVTSNHRKVPLGTPASPTSSIVYTDRLRVLGKQLFGVRLCTSALFVNELYLSQPSEALEESIKLLDDQQNIVAFMKANLLYNSVVPYRGVNRPRPSKETDETEAKSERTRLREETCVGAFYTMVGILAVKHGKAVEPFIDETLIHGANGVISMAMKRASKQGWDRYAEE